MLSVMRPEINVPQVAEARAHIKAGGMATGHTTTVGRWLLQTVIRARGCLVPLPVRHFLRSRKAYRPKISPLTGLLGHPLLLPPYPCSDEFAVNLSLIPEFGNLRKRFPISSDAHLVPHAGVMHVIGQPRRGPSEVPNAGGE